MHTCKVVECKTSFFYFICCTGISLRIVTIYYAHLRTKRTSFKQYVYNYLPFCWHFLWRFTLSPYILYEHEVFFLVCNGTRLCHFSIYFVFFVRETCFIPLHFIRNIVLTNKLKTIVSVYYFKTIYTLYHGYITSKKQFARIVTGLNRFQWRCNYPVKQ